MYEIKEIIILAAGQGKRMGPLVENKPKCLLEYKGEAIIKRLIRQLKEKEVKKIIVVVGFKKDLVTDILEKSFGRSDINIEIVENPIYEKDVNIYSMQLALEHVHGPFVVFEADTVMEDSLVQYVIGADFEGKSVWFTRGNFSDSQNGGILKSDTFGNVRDIKIVPEYSKDYSNYRKLTGLMRVGPNEKATFKNLIKAYSARSIQQYYLIPWMENIDKLPSVEGNVEHYLFETFNTSEDYEKIFRKEFDQKFPLKKEIYFLEPEVLSHVEGFDEKRAQILADKIKSEGFWTKPIYTEKNHNLVLDGQHRLAAAKKLGIRKVPVIGFDYGEVRVWTLRKEEHVDIPTVIKRAKEGNIYPPKTVKHKFPKINDEMKIPLENLKRKELPNKRLIILAAGQGFKLDGFNKLLIKDPQTGKPIIERYKELFPNYEITVVIGHKAIEIMNEHPNFNYILNNQWRITGNSYSLALVLDERPSVILSADFIFGEELRNLIETSPENSILFSNKENKSLNTVRGRIENSRVKSLYLGEDNQNPEVVGIFKISNADVLREWKKACLSNKNTFAGINLPLNIEDIFAVNTENIFIHEINTHLDYLNLLKKLKNGY